MNIKNNIKKLFADIKDRPLYWLTMVTALIGAYWSSDASAFYRGLGFLVWIGSNGYLLIQFNKEKNLPMVLQFLAYEIFNTRGVLNNWFPGWEDSAKNFLDSIINLI
jgi:hypothetical protein